MTNGHHHTLTGDIRLHENFHSRILDNQRNVIVWLPPGYHDNPSRYYPVLYLHDGQNLFDGATSYIPGKEWQVDETAQYLVEAGKIVPLIIVGIYNTGVQRIDEYTPTWSARLQQGGKADLYGRLLLEELLPFIAAQYRTLSGAENTGLGGSSLGGLVTLHLGLQYPETFGRLAMISPSIWWEGGVILERVAQYRRHFPQRIWLDMGTHEGSIGLVYTQRLRDVLTQRGWKPEKDLRYLEIRGAVHDETAWGNRFDKVLKYLFPLKERLNKGESP